MLWIIVMFIVLSMVLCLIKAISGPTTYDRILAGNAFGTKTVVLIALLAYTIEDMMILDIALVYVLINFIATIAFLKYFRHSSLGRG